VRTALSITSWILKTFANSYTQPSQTLSRPLSATLAPFLSATPPSTHRSTATSATPTWASRSSPLDRSTQVSALLPARPSQSTTLRTHRRTAWLRPASSSTVRIPIAVTLGICTRQSLTLAPIAFSLRSVQWHAVRRPVLLSVQRDMAGELCYQRWSMARTQPLHYRLQLRIQQHDSKR